MQSDLYTCIWTHPCTRKHKHTADIQIIKASAFRNQGATCDCCTFQKLANWSPQGLLKGVWSFHAVKISFAKRKSLLRWQRVPACAPSCRPLTLVSPGRRAAQDGGGPGGAEASPGLQFAPRLTGAGATSPPPPVLDYQILQGTHQITHLVQISPVVAHLTVMLLMLYFTVTPNLRPCCTVFCHLRCKINKGKARITVY